MPDPLYVLLFIHTRRQALLTAYLNSKNHHKDIDYIPALNEKIPLQRERHFAKAYKNNW
jgi:hypothetical protein